MTRDPAAVLRLRVRRLTFAVLVLVTTLTVGLLLLGMLRANGMQLLEYPILVLATLLLIPVVLSFWMAAFGVWVEHAGDPLALDLTRAAEEDALEDRIAVVVPIYDEDPGRVLAGVRACHESLESTGQLASFDFFVLSDTRDPWRWLEEEAAVAALRARLPDPGRLHYRNRAHNVDRKAGNILDFCQRWGDRYECMVVFDADSVMSGETLVTLARAMQRHPGVGIIQVPPVPVNGNTLFSRVQQFAARAYGPTWAAGLAWLQDGEGNYYGHNAILRIAPFREHCRLPRLPGKEPLGGAILSHDFVEAALLRRGGHRIHLAADLGGSYEELPATLIDYVARDRRWCQGNLQHARLLGMPGLHLMSRTHLAMGVMAYAAAPVWLLLLLLWTVEALRAALTPHEYFAPGGSLFPTWEVSIETRAKLLFALAMLLLFVPRVLAVASRLRDRSERENFGGARRLLASVVTEWLLSLLLAPVLMLEHTRFVLGILGGRSVGWNAQPRGDRGIGLREALRRHLLAEVVGIGWGVLLILLAPEFVGWMVPVLAGLVLSIPLSVLSSRVAAGRWAERHGLLWTPEEVAPEPVVVRLRELLARRSDESAARQGTALERVLEDPELRDVHLSFVTDSGAEDPLVWHEVQGAVLKCRLHGPAALTEAEQRLVLQSPEAIRELSALGTGGV